MNKRISLVITAIATAGLSGCTGMSPEECIATDWTAIGYEDGARGYTSDRFSGHRKACAKHGITADFSDYQQGRNQGLVEYCQPGRGFNIGVNGGRYYGVCSAELEGDFLDAFNTGHHLYALRSEVNSATSAINSKQYELDQIDEKLIAHGVAIVAPETTSEERVFLLNDMRQLAERTGQLEAEIEELQVTRAHAQAELENFQLVVADMGY
tara:strand:- start:8107 stop:8739 length:633 start_codon:yes stop_codon:yes gene_type:complete